MVAVRISRKDVSSQQGESFRTPSLPEAGDFEKVAEPADKPGSVVDSHSSRRRVTAALEQPTRTRRGQRHEVPIWSCSRWGLPYRSVAGLAVRSYRTISPLPACLRRRRRYLSVALSVGSRRPGVTWHLALWSPDFPRHPLAPKCTGMTRLSGRLRRGYCRMCGATAPRGIVCPEKHCLTGFRVPSPWSRAPPAASPPGIPHPRQSGARGSSRVRRRPLRRWCWRGCRSRGRG